MRIRPGRTRSLFVGILMVLVTVVGLVMMSRFGGLTGGMFGPFIIIWVVIGLAGAAMAFYNALSREGLPLYEVDVEEDEEDQTGQNGAGFCPQCGRSVGEEDRFCRRCGASLDL
jgi:hypothetical protein